MSNVNKDTRAVKGTLTSTADVTPPSTNIELFHINHINPYNSILMFFEQGTQCQANTSLIK